MFTDKQMLFRLITILKTHSVLAECSILQLCSTSVDTVAVHSTYSRHCYLRG